MERHLRNPSLWDLRQEAFVFPGGTFRKFRVDAGVRRPMRPRAPAPMRPCSHTPMLPCAQAPMRPCAQIFPAVTSTGFAGALGQSQGSRLRRVPFGGQRGTSDKTKKTRPGWPRPGLFVLFPAITYSLTFRQYHRREGLNCRVRNGNGCFPFTMDTGKLG